MNQENDLWTKVLESPHSKDGWVIFLIENGNVLETEEIRYYDDYEPAKEMHQDLQKKIIKNGYNISVGIQASKSLDNFFLFIHNNKRFLMKFN